MTTDEDIASQEPKPLRIARWLIVGAALSALLLGWMGFIRLDRGAPDELLFTLAFAIMGLGAVAAAMDNLLVRTTIAPRLLFFAGMAGLVASMFFDIAVGLPDFLPFYLGGGLGLLSLAIFIYAEVWREGRPLRAREDNER